MLTFFYVVFKIYIAKLDRHIQGSLAIMCKQEKRH